MIISSFLLIFGCFLYNLLRPPSTSCHSITLQKIEKAKGYPVSPKFEVKTNA